MTAPSLADAESFYRAGALGLRALEAREALGRRLGPAADATWRAFRSEPGELTDRDRLDILVRDAAAVYSLAFAPRRIFALQAATAPTQAPSIDPLEARPGDVLGGKLKVKRLLGTGATARVLGVERGDTTLALKVPLAPEFEERLRAEAEVLR